MKAKHLAEDVRGDLLDRLLELRLGEVSRLGKCAPEAARPPRKPSFKTKGRARTSNVARLASRFTEYEPQDSAGEPPQRRPVARHSSLLKIQHVGSVRAAIRIFEGGLSAPPVERGTDSGPSSCEGQAKRARLDGHHVLEGGHEAPEDSDPVPPPEPPAQRQDEDTDPVPPPAPPDQRQDEDTASCAVRPNHSFLWGRPSAADPGPDQTHQAVRVLIDYADYDDAGAQDGHSYEYCESAPSYDDCEGEGYEFVGEAQAPAAEANIYDDVRCASDCYESVYALTATPPASLAGSFCDKSNSLYGVAEPRFDSASVSQASTLSADYASHTSTLERPGPGSEASDEWMDMDGSYSEGGTEAVKGQERPRARRSPRWSRKVRRQRLRPARRPPGPAHPVFVSSSSGVCVGDGGHRSVPRGARCGRAESLVTLRAVVYVGDTQESQEVTFLVEKEGGETSTESEPDHHYEVLYEPVGQNNHNHNHNHKHNHITEEDDFDSFDSDDSSGTFKKSSTQGSFDVASARLPDLPSGQNIYGITKIAEAAGKKMLKFRKSLSRMRTKRNSTDLGVLAVAPARTPSPPEPSPPPPPPPPAPGEKTASAASLARRKYWSLRRFRRSLSSVSQYPPALPHRGAKETATFYLTPAVDVDSGAPSPAPALQERRSSAGCSEAGDAPSSRPSCGTLGQEAAARRRPPLERPHSPPPLPPSAPPEIPKRVPRRQEKKTGNSSWYAECGLFDQAELANRNHSDGQRRSSAKSDKPNSYSLYAEVGLWDAAAYSQDTSQSSGGSDNAYGYDVKDVAETRFANEPLYQFYTAAVAEQAQGGARGDTDSDGYEEICDLGSPAVPAPRPSAMELIRPRDGRQRTLWCELPEVLGSQVLCTINAHQRKLQEAKFELITSEASYVNSLNMLEKHFMSSRELRDETILSKNDRRTLFSNVLPVRNCSTKFLSDLEACWQDSVMLHGICDVIYEHATSHFGVYVKYCSNQIYLDRTLRRLKEQHGRFADALAQLEAGPVCQSLSLHSFLMLPMQRITRLPLLVDAVLTRLDPGDDEFPSCRLALAALNNVVQECNEGARRMERMEEILILNRQLEFPKELRALPIISSSRWLVKKGELTHIVWRGDEGKLTFGRKFSKVALHVFLFTDVLIITKKKSEDSYVVVDYCQRSLLQMAVAGDVPHLPVKFTADHSRHLLLLTMLQNHDNKTVEMVLSCPLESDRQRWLEAVTPPAAAPGETVYPEWDTPQVTAVHPYTARQPDELSLGTADVVNVLRKMPDASKAPAKS
ncbi:rho guanine nucleotide exchange factor 15-like isoform X2 [Bacillus rossius redtenbacheri]|uniref:rho guanine nucleotide exchange factor 15-like isoform X2 n=1 Tax=Bacillus rossius redtenbacheri TaxID=93214 RepID=UPI002FDC9E6B